MLFRGFSGALIWRYAGSDAAFCLRGWPPEMRDAARLHWIHRTLRAIHNGGCTLVPAPLTASNQQSWVDWQGRYWELTPWMPGKADYREDASSTRLEAAVVALATLHRVAAETAASPPARGLSPALLRRAELLREIDHRRLETLRQAMRRPAAGPMDEIACVAHQILALYPEIAPSVTSQTQSVLAQSVPLQTCHGDLWHDHVLFTGQRVSGIIDFGNLRVDTPMTDLARLLGSVAGDDPEGWQMGISAYEKLLPVSGELRPWIAIFDRASVLLSGMNWLQWIFVERRQFSWSQVQDRLDHILQRMQNLV